MESKNKKKIKEDKIQIKGKINNIKNEKNKIIFDKIVFFENVLNQIDIQIINKKIDSLKKR